MKKIIIIITSLIAITAGVIGIILITTNKEDNTKKDNNNKVIKEKDKKEDCSPITGGSFSLIFETDSNNKLDTMSICIACAPDTYKDIPKPSKDGYDFEGWYYDKEFKTKVEVTNTKDITPIPIKDKDCITGYQDITLYAKWKKKEEKPIQNKEVTNNNNQVNNNVTTNESQPTNEPTLKNVLKRPTETGTFSYNCRNNCNVYTANLIKTSYRANIYPVADGRVVSVSGSGMSNYYKQKLYDIGIQIKYNDTFYVVEYFDIAEVQLSVGQTITSDTVIGKPKQDIPIFYMNIYPVKCPDEVPECSLNIYLIGDRKYKYRRNLSNYLNVRNNESWETR